MLLEECLKLVPKSPELLTVGSPEMIRKEVGRLIEVDHEYLMATAGAILSESSSSYLLMRDSTTLNEFSFKSGWDEVRTPFQSKALFADLFSQITGIDTYYTLDTRVTRNGAIKAADGVKLKVRLDWLEETTRSTSGDDEYAEIVSPVTGQLFDGEDLLSHFIYYQEIKENKSAANFYMTATHSIIGEYGGRKFEVEYRQESDLVLFWLEERLCAVMPLINMNPNSRSARGVKLTRNKVTMVQASGFNAPDVSLETAEWYPIYVTDQVDDSQVINAGYILLLLFFSVSHGG